MLYRETARGRMEMLLEEDLPVDERPVAVTSEDPLLQLSFAKSSRSFWGKRETEKIAVFCPNKFGRFVNDRKLGRGRPTICLHDADGDGALDHTLKLFNTALFGGFEDPYISTFISTVGDLEPFAPPIRYSRRLFAPAEGREGVVELRYEGLKDGKIALTVLARTADATVPAYEMHIEALRPAGAPVEVSIEHPLIASPRVRGVVGYDRPPPPAGQKRNPLPAIPVMKLAIAKADAKGLTGTLVAPYAQWNWYETWCPQFLHDLPDKNAPETAPAPKEDRCEFVYWDDNGEPFGTSFDAAPAKRE